MKKNQTYAVFGLGRYGSAVARQLSEEGAEVIAVDEDEAVVNSYAAQVSLCKCADVTDPDSLQQLGISNVDVVIVAFGSRLEASVMTTMLCKEIGVGKVIVKCDNKMHGKILYKVGADKIIYPEEESGVRLAKNLLSHGFMDLIELSKDVSMVELHVRPEWIGKSIVALNLRKKHSINIVAICEGKNICTNIDPEMILQSSMKLIVIANRSKLEKL